jgi:YD repeat-containing protein
VSITSGNNSIAVTASDGTLANTITTTYNLPSSASYTYDQNGNMTADALHTSEYDDDHISRSERHLMGTIIVAGLGSHYQPVAVQVASQWRSEFVYDLYGNVLGKFDPFADANTHEFSSKKMHARPRMDEDGF